MHVQRILAVSVSSLLLLAMGAFAVGTGKGPRSGTPITLNFYSLNGDASSAKGEEALDAIEQKIWEDLGINADINMISSDSFSTDQIAVKITAGELDAISSNMPMTKWQSFVEKGILLPLDGLLSSYGKDIYKQVDKKLWDPYKYEKKTYFIPIQAPVPFYCSTWVRMDLFKKYGITKVPTTVSELIKGIKVVKQREPDLIGMTAGHITWITNSGPLNYHRVDAKGNQTLSNDAGTAMAKYVETSLGQPVFFEDPKFKASLKRFADAYASGVLDPEIFSTTFDHANQLSAADRVICLGDSYGFQKTADRKAGLDPEFPVEKGKEQEWAFLTNLTNDINNAPTTWKYSYETGMFIGLVASTSHPTEIVKILNWICASQDNYALANWGVKGKHWDYKKDGKVDFFKDDSGNRVVTGNLGGMMLNLYSSWWVPLTEYYYGMEWKKINAAAPATKTWSSCDGFINYQYKTDATVRSSLDTIASEAFVNIATGKVDVDKGLSTMVSNLQKAGYNGWYVEKNEQYCKGVGIRK